MQATNRTTTSGYIVALDTNGVFEYYSISLELVKAVLRQPPTKRISFIKQYGESLATTSSTPSSLWIDASVDPVRFWNSEGEADWREFLIEEAQY